MKQTLILFFTTVLVFLMSGVQAQLSYANNTAVNISLSGCGVNKLCLQAPDGCDPAGNSTCLFGSVRVGNMTSVNGPELAFQLSGNSTGYIALGLSTIASPNTSMLFVCAQNNSVNASLFSFLTKSNTNGMLASLVVNVTEIRGVVINNTIQCEFHVPGLNASSTTTRSQDTTFIVLLGSGAVNADGSLGSFNPNLRSNALDLTNPAANVANTTSTPSNSTIAVTTATSSGASRTLYSDAVLLLMSVLTLSALKTV